MLASVECFAGHLEQGVQRATLARGPLPMVPALSAVLLRRFPLELLLLLLLLLQGWVMQAVVHAVVQAVVMRQGVGAAGVGDGASPGRGGAA